MKKHLILAAVIIFISIITITIIINTNGSKNRNNEKVAADDYLNKMVFSHVTQAAHTTNLMHIKKQGSSSERPTGIVKGFVYFDTTLNRPIYWNGKVWIDSPLINIKDFGAKGDGIADDTKVIQNALNIARDYGSIKLYFPKGVYHTKSLRIYKNTSVTLNQKATIKRVGTGYYLFTNGQVGNTHYATKYNGEGNIHFKGGTIDLNTINAPIPDDKGTVAFNIAHAENISFRNLTIINGQNGHYFQISSSKNVLFDRCWFGNVHYTNTTSKNYELIQIEEATEISFPTFGSYDRTVSTNITIQNSHFENVIRAIGTHSYSRAKDGITPLRYNKNIVIRNNVFKKSISQFGHFEGFKNVVFENNVVVDSGEDPIYFNQSSHNTVKNNYFIRSQRSGLNLKQADSNIIERNSFIDTCLDSSYPCSTLLGVTSHQNKIINNKIVRTKNTTTLQLTKSKGNDIKNNKVMNDFKSKTAILNQAKQKIKIYTEAMKGS
ncbi:right-handed parallel beta-helix repeat-containing protein [Bacillus sp. AFS037270]|uniref:right-handed parallel beta-helix repeat-containing protein n=1 Tax=Bacillus sp. AFS037270 TaxID=2033499 RepID=UPI000BFD76EF|nr:right-handed parallel beta-helix repeat-containing protein [Bacillus sp. AFS037270]PGV53330.1 hypothetical protein COD92_06980 [Bacillus sp. AFS037270]